MLHVVLIVWGTLIRRGLRFVQWRRNRNSVKKRDPICEWTNEIAQHQSQAIKLDLSCSGQVLLKTGDRSFLRVTNRPGMAGTVQELTSGVPCPGLGHFCPGIY